MKLKILMTALLLALTTLQTAHASKNQFNLSIGSESVPNLLALRYLHDLDPQWQLAMDFGFSAALDVGVAVRYLFTPQDRWTAVAGVGLAYFTAALPFADDADGFHPVGQVGMEWRSASDYRWGFGATISNVAQSIVFPYGSFGWRF